jgi:hypothetical protein
LVPETNVIAREHVERRGIMWHFVMSLPAKRLILIIIVTLRNGVWIGSQ